MGRNMFSPLRGPWADEDWKGWWGDNPPFKHPVFVLTHHPRPTLEFENGTSFHFVGGSPEQVLEQAQAAAGDKDVKVNGGVSTVRAFWMTLVASCLINVCYTFGQRIVGRAEKIQSLKVESPLYLSGARVGDTLLEVDGRFANRTICSVRWSCRTDDRP